MTFKDMLVIGIIAGAMIVTSFIVYSYESPTNIDAQMMFSNLYKVNGTWYEHCLITFQGSKKHSYSGNDLVLRLNMPSFCHIEVISMNPLPYRFAHNSGDGFRNSTQNHPVLWKDYSYNAWWRYDIENNTSIASNIDYSTITIMWRDYCGGIYSAELLISWNDTIKYIKYCNYHRDYHLYVLPDERSTWNHNTDIGFYGYFSDKYYYKIYIDEIGKIDWEQKFIPSDFQNGNEMSKCEWGVMNKLN